MTSFKTSNTKGLVECRACGSFKIKYLGLLQRQTSFAGKAFESNDEDTCLYKCNNCYLMMRHPVLTIEKYNELYEEASSSVWSSSNDGLRCDQDVVRSLIICRKKSMCKVLDVGCYTGDLLSSLPINYAKYGIEMSMAASEEAKKKGIKIIGNDLYSLDNSEKFDLILAVDVIEHTQNPEKFIKNLSSLLLPNGEILISTGNTDNWLWVLLKNRFWYSKFPEHISFIGRKWLELFCKNNSFTLVEVKYFSYVPISPATFVKNITKLFLSILHVLPERLSNTTKDHFCFVIRKVL